MESFSGQSTDDLHRKLEGYISRKKKLESEIISIEKKIYAYEGIFLDDKNGKGILRKYSSQYRKERKVGINDYDRVFSADLPK
ncbi:hypothetical protein NEOKW01_1100 [Nematocida sp. AWRm80]|nr:hypothetical protein NEOKW01_1100 [Nematocida sp. AWRm80]